MARIFIYVAAAYLVFLLCDYRSKKEALFSDDDRKISVIIALIWPLTLAPLLFYMIASSVSRRNPSHFEPPRRDAAPMTRWKHTKPKGGEYNDMTFGVEKGEAEGASAEDMAAFIETLARRPDAPLPNELTISYPVTGISKTYPPGTPFPSTLVNDWKRGFFMGKDADDHIDS